MTSLIFIFFIVMLMFLSTKSSGEFFNAFNILAIPYTVIVTFNNFFASYFGFYKISDATLFMLGCGILFFFLGFLIPIKPRKYRQLDLHEFQRKYNLKYILVYSLFVEIVALFRIVVAINSNGLEWLTNDLNEGYLMTGLLGHLLLTLYITSPLLFYGWLLNKRRIGYLVSVVLSITILFFTFVKYHSICMIAILFFYTVSNDRKHLKKGLITLALTCIALFITSYIFVFWSRKSLIDVETNFYFNHLWKYIGGSVINDNLIFTNGINGEVDGFYKIASFLMPLPNMFLGAFGLKQYYKKVGLPMYLVAIHGESSNVIDQIGYLFPSDGSLVDYLLFAAFLIILGFLSRIVFERLYLGKYSLRLFGTIYLVFFCFFSFFGVYATLSNPWECLVWSLVLPRLFQKRKLRWRRIKTYERLSNYHTQLEW